MPSVHSRHHSHIHGSTPVSGFSRGGRPGLHGMIAFGEPNSGLYLSHIPMFHQSHDVQVVFSVKLSGAPPDLSRELFTFKPTNGRLSLDDLVLGNIKTVEGELYRGNFEQGGTPLGTVTAELNKTISPLTQVLGSNREAQPSYVAFGTPTHAYLVHAVGSPPSFDQILRADLRHSGISEEDLAAGVRLSLPGKANSVENRLKVGPAEVSLADGRRLQIRVTQEVSTLVGPDFTNTPEE